MKLPAVKKSILLQIDAAGVIACVLMSLLAYFTIIGPLVNKGSNLGRQRRELAVQSDKASNLKTSMAHLGNQLTGLIDEAAMTRIRLHSAEQINMRIAELTEVLSNCLLEVDDVRIGQVIAGPRCDIVPIGITGSGGYKQSAKFLHELGRTLPDIGIAKLELWGNPANPEEPRRFHFELLWYTVPKAVASQKLKS
jgi:Tfp pilus assembly protein PilO